MRILILGANGLLGCDLVREFRGLEVIRATSRDADIRDLVQVRSLVAKSQPEWIVLAAAYTDVDGSEKDPDRAFAVNRDGTRNVAMAAQEAGCKLVYLSTDYVFDGQANQPYEPSDAIHPLSAYGASKAEGEAAVQECGGHWLIGRTSWLFGAAGLCFPEKILRAAETQSELKVVDDQIGSPTYTRDLARAIRDLILKDAGGIVHITNAGFCSWFAFTKEILNKAGRTTPVCPIRTADARRPAQRPAYSVMSPAALAGYGISLPAWQDALDRYLTELRTTGRLAS